MRKFVVTVFVFLVMACSINLANAAEVINIDDKSSHYMKMDMDIVRIAVGSDKVAKVVQIPSSFNEFLIAATGIGSTSLFVWTEDNQRHDYIINVSPEDTGQARIIEEAIGLPDVHVRMVEKRILLTGTVKNQYEKNYAIQIARLYSGSGSDSSVNFGSNVNPQLSTQSSKAESSSTTLTNTNKVEDSGNVIDLLQMLQPTQIKLEAQILSINSGDAKDLGILYGNSPIGAPGIFAVGETVKNITKKIWGIDRNGDAYVSDTYESTNRTWTHSDINLSINALVTKNKAKILSRPSIMTLSGEQATIQIGGEIPFSAINSNNVASIDFKKYGIILQFKPIVDSQNNIVTTIYTEVSNVSGEYVGDNPIVATRRADAVVSLKSGTTMVIGGLMDSSERKIVNKIPLLGDIPIIGEFFKYSSKTKDKQELIILVTPYIVGEQDTSYADMTEQMEEHYREGVKEKNSRNKVDIQE